MNCNEKYPIGLRAHDLGSFAGAEAFSHAIKEKNCPSLIQFAPSKLLKSLPPVDCWSREKATEIAKVFQRHGINIAVFGCYMNPVVEEEDAKKLMLSRYKASFELASIFGNPVVGTETGSDHQVLPLHLTETRRIDNFYHFLEDVLPYAQHAHAVLAIEPVKGHTLNSFERIDAMLSRFDCENLRLIFDPSNLIPQNNGTGSQNYLDAEVQRTLFAQFFSQYHHKISAIHLKDFVMIDGVKKNTLPLFTGNFNIDGLIAELKKTGISTPLLLENADIATIKETTEKLAACIGSEAECLY